MQRRPTVSVAICLFNSSRFIDETLESVFAQTFDDYEVILVDDGSTDGCADAIERRHRDRRLTIIRQRHQGLSIARRLSIASAAGEFVAFLDHDDLWLPDKLDRQIAAARADPSVALLFSDCVYMNEHGHILQRLSDQYGLASLDLTGTRGYVELLRRGCFVWQSTAVARTDALRSVNSFNPAYPYIADYDTWLQLARRYGLHYTPAVLAKWRVHANQFTNRCPEVTLADHRKLLAPLARTASNPHAIRVAVGDRLLGQHRESCRRLLKQKRFGLAARAACGMLRYPARLRAYCSGTIAQLPIVGPEFYPCLQRCVSSSRVVAIAPDARSATNIADTCLDRRQHAGNDADRLFQPGQRADPDAGSPEMGASFMWSHPRQAERRSHRRLEGDAARVSFHPLGWRALRWTDVYQLVNTTSDSDPAADDVDGAPRGRGVLRHSSGHDWGARPYARTRHVPGGRIDGAHSRTPGMTSSRLSARVTRRLWRWLASPRGRAPHPDTVEVIVWRGRFRWAASRRVAIVQDLTTHIHPELHTAGNVAEFDEFLEYVQRHAEAVATVSEHSRRDIIERLAVFPESVSTIPMPLNPCYVSPRFNPAFVAMHGIAQPYVVCVGLHRAQKELTTSRAGVRVVERRGRGEEPRSCPGGTSRLGRRLRSFPDRERCVSENSTRSVSFRSNTCRRSIILRRRLSARVSMRGSAFQSWRP